MVFGYKEVSGLAWVNSGNLGILESTREYSGMTWGSY